MVQKEIFSSYRCNIISVFNILHLTEALVNTPGLMKTFVLILLAIFVVLLSTACAERQCNACGPECSGACGTAMFRACCFNYNRKRSLQLIPPQMDHTEQDNGGTQTLDGTLASLPNVIGLKQAVWRARKAGCAVDY